MRSISLILAVSLVGWLLPAQVATTAPSLSIWLQENTTSANGRVAVTVSDENGQPVPGATVVFRPAGAGEPAIVQTDTSGQAAVDRMRPSQITASKGTAHAGLLLEAADVSAVTSSATAQSAAPVVAQAPGIPASWMPAVVTANARRPVKDDDESAGDTSEVSKHTTKSGEAPPPGAVADPDSPNANVPVRHSFGPDGSGTQAPRVSIESTGNGRSSDHHVRNRVLIAIGVAAGAGVAFALLHGSGSSSSSSAGGVTVGPPGISVGHP